MRLDLFLKTSRLIKSRSVAQEFCDAGMVEINSAPAKSSKEVKAGDKLTIRRRNRIYPVAALGATAVIAFHSAFDFSLQIPAIALTYAVILGLGVSQSFATRES